MEILQVSSSNNPAIAYLLLCVIIHNNTAKDLCDAFKRQMCGSEYGEQDKKAAILYEYETFKATEGEQLLDTCLRYLQVINDLKKCGYKKENCDMNDAMGYKKKAVMATSDPLALVVKQKEGHFTKDCKKAKVKDYNYYKTKMLLAKKDDDEQVLLAEDQAWMKSSNDSDQDISAKMVFMAKMEKVLSDSKESSSSAEETIAEHTNSLKLYVLTVIFEKIIIDLEDKVRVISESENQSENDCQVVEKGCDNLENIKVIAPGMFKINVSQSVSPISVSKMSSDSNNAENKPKRKRRKRISSKQNDKQVNNDALRANGDFVHFYYLDNLSNVRRPKHKGVIWKKKGSSNTSSVDLSSDTRSAYACNDAMNVSCNSRLYASDDVNDLFVFDDICLWIIDSGCSKHMSGNRALLTNFVEKFLGTVRFGNNDFTVIAVYGDVVIGSMTIKKVYYVEDGVDLLTGDRSSNLYIVSLNDIALNSLAYLLAKASSSRSWLWHQRLSHLNFATINNLVKNNLVRGLLKMKFEKDHLCSSCEQGKIHWKHHKSKMDFASNKPLFLLYCVRVRTNNGIEFKNKTLAKFFDKIKIAQHFFTARTPQQNGVVERRNRTLVEAVRTMLTFANLPLFLWAKAIVTVCFTQNHSIIHKHFDKTPYELINKRKPNIKFFYVFGCRCYSLNDYDDVGKLKAKGDIRVFVGYSKESAAFRFYNKRTRKIHESVNVNFDEISKMASKQFRLESGLSNLNEIRKSLNPMVSQVSETSKKDLDDLFHNFYDEYFNDSKITKSPTTNVETSNDKISSHEEEVFHESFESFQE
nr:hypothetical protein [Tanacetum cinerariifolium]